MVADPTDKTRITLDDAEAEILNQLNNYGEPTYLNEYQPKYYASTDMASLQYTSISPLGSYPLHLAFTIANSHISSMYLDFSASQTVSEDLSELVTILGQLHHLAELILVLPVSITRLDVGQFDSLQYLEISMAKQARFELLGTSSLDNLVVLVVNGQLIQFPELTAGSLQRLVLPQCMSTVFPLSICKLTNLVWLELGSEFTSIPDDIVELNKLIILDLWSHNLTSLPKNIGLLCNLHHLTIQAPCLESFPDSFVELQQITDLYLWNLPMETMPKQITSLPQLKYLWMRNNSSFQGKLRYLDENIGNLSQLEELQVNSNQITDLPSSFTSLCQLKRLNLSINQIRHLPDDFSSLRQLEEFKIYYNPIEHLPEDLGLLTNLKLLDISDTSISRLPESLGKLQKLQSIEAIGCPLADLPSSITQLQPSQINNFQLSLAVNVEILNDEVQQWLERLQKQSGDDMTFNLTPYEPEEKSEKTLSHKQISPEIDNNIRTILTQALTQMIAHPTFEEAVVDFPMEYINETMGKQSHSFFHLLEHIRLSLEDISEYITTQEYMLRDFPDDYWHNIIADEQQFVKSIEQIRNHIASCKQLLADDNINLYEPLRYQQQSGHTIFREVILIITHTSFHLGQFIAMRKALGIWK